MQTKAKEQAERFKFEPQIFDIIYKLTEWFDTEFENRLPFEEVETVLGELKVIKTFSTNGEKQVIGGKVLIGLLKDNGTVKIVRRDFDLGRGKITELQQMKMKAKEVLEGNECGLMVESKVEIIQGDIIKLILIEKKRLT